MKDRVEASPLLSHLACHVIPFGLDLETWRPLDRNACRSRLGILQLQLQLVEQPLRTLREHAIKRTTQLFDFKLEQSNQRVGA